MTDDARLTELEIALSHHGRLGEELSELVREQAARIDRLERRIAAMVERLDSLEADGGAPPVDRPPPHW